MYRFAGAMLRGRAARAAGRAINRGAARNMMGNGWEEK